MGSSIRKSMPHYLVFVMVAVLALLMMDLEAIAESLQPKNLQDVERNIFISR